MTFTCVVPNPRDVIIITLMPLIYDWMTPSDVCVLDWADQNVALLSIHCCLIKPNYWHIVFKFQTIVQKTNTIVNVKKQTQISAFLCGVWMLRSVLMFLCFFFFSKRSNNSSQRPSGSAVVNFRQRHVGSTCCYTRKHRALYSVLQWARHVRRRSAVGAGACDWPHWPLFVRMRYTQRSVKAARQTPIESYEILLGNSEWLLCWCSVTSLQVVGVSYVVEALEEFVLYNFRVAAVNENGEGEASSEVVVRTFSDGESIPSPSNHSLQY